jgi:hypothetical protein
VVFMMVEYHFQYHFGRIHSSAKQNRCVMKVASSPLRVPGKRPARLA